MKEASLRFPPAIPSAPYEVVFDDDPIVLEIHASDVRKNFCLDRSWPRLVSV